MNKGIDVSIYQGAIDWAKVKKSGVKFAMIKISQGKAYSYSYPFCDEKYRENIEGAFNAGLGVGAYHYLCAQTVEEAISEAEFFLQAIKPYRSSITYYAAVDVEDEHYLPKNKRLLTDIVNAFCDTIKSNGFEPMVYTNPDYLTYRLNDVSRWKLWLAMWRNVNNVPSESDYPNLTLWQYDADSVSGISTLCDVDLEIKERISEEDKPMTNEERKAFNDLVERVATLETESAETANRLEHYDDMGVYDNAAIKWAYIDKNLPSWSADTVKKLYSKKILKGNEKGSLELSRLMLRLLVILDRAGVFD